jgi:hypothetical protein
MFRISTVYLDAYISASSISSQIKLSFQPWNESNKKRVRTMRMSTDTKMTPTLFFGKVKFVSPKTKMKSDEQLTSR